MTQIDLIVGARPNFMKAAPVLEQFRIRQPGWHSRLIHTGQHYDEKLSDLFFRQLGMPAPDVNLNIGSGSHAVQTARIMMALETVFTEQRPDLVMVFGDINSTAAAALVAAKLGIPLAHVEAGLRSFDRSMPEEINRLVTDAISDLLFVTEPSAAENLQREGVPAEKIFFVGNTMIDTLLKHRAHALALQMAARFGVTPNRYAVVTLHRPSNVDDAQSLARIIASLLELAAQIPVIFPVHPRTQQRLTNVYNLRSLAAANLHCVEPLGYLEFIGLVADAAVVLTDSGGVQEETTILGVPCITLRENTERPITLTVGTNRLVGRDPQRMIAEALSIIASTGKPAPGMIPEKWDGKAAERVVSILEQTKWHV